jgi:ubiquinone/menaquinone biosynthesis C-methylase UbiE
MDKKERSKVAFDSKAASYDSAPIGSMTRQLFPVIMKKLSSVKFSRVLDLGCGTGALMEAMFAAYPGSEVYGLDLSDKMIETARARLGGRATLTVGDAEHLPYDDNFFDVITCNYSFHHYPSPEAAVAEPRAC